MSSTHDHQAAEPEDLRWNVLAAVVCGVLWVVGHLIEWQGGSYQWWFAAAAVVGGIPTLVATVQSLAARKLDVDFLMLAGAVGASAIGYFEEAAVLMFLFTLSHVLEEYALGRTRRALESLVALRPDSAAILRDGQAVRVPLDEVQVGETMVVRPGERLALDGVITSGAADIDEAALTGESAPKWKEAGASLLAGSVNLSGALEVKVSRLAAESTLARMVHLVEDARSSRAPTQRVLDRFVVFYVLAIVGASITTALVPPLLGLADWSAMFYRAMVLLVVASPCALVISTPATILSAIASAAMRGILFKGGNAVEQLGKVQVAAFDKTGTLTDGQLTVSEVTGLQGMAADEALAWAAAAERSSEHPLAMAIVREAQSRGLTLPETTAFHTTAGLGVEAEAGGREVVVGSPRFLQSRRVSCEALTQAPPGTAAKTVWVAVDRRIVGRVVLADHLRPGAPAAVAALRKLGVQSVMLTGDEHPVAAQMAAAAGIEEFHAGLLPDEKVRALRALAKGGRSTLMVGDGVNDAPALAAADVGVAMGAAGTDLAIEAADVVLMTSSLEQLVDAVALGRQARTILWQNLLFAAAVIIVLITLTLIGVLPMSIGVAAHEGSTLLVVLNGLRLLASGRGTRHARVASLATAPVVAAADPAEAAP